MNGKNLSRSKKLLEKNLVKQEQSTSLQASATKILNYLINDMLDYAQLSAGQFRKFQKRFNLIKSINDIIRILRFKADELDIAISIDLSNLNSNKSTSLDQQIKSESLPQKSFDRYSNTKGTEYQPSEFFIHFDEQRLQ